MAKSKSFFGLRTGSTKSLTFQVYRGLQVTKDRVYRVSNPRSEAQMTQRALIPIVAAARSALKGLVDHSFEGVAYGEASLREFSKQNLRSGALSVTSYSPNGVSNPGFADLIVSNGSINVKYSIDSDEQSNTIEGARSDYPPFKFPAADKGVSAAGILKYLETYARENNVDLIAPGTQLSFLTIYQTGTVMVKTATGKIEAPTSGFILNRIYIPNGDSNSQNSYDFNDQWRLSAAVAKDASAAYLVNSEGDTLEISCNGVLSLRSLTRAASINKSNCGLALILSRYENGVWKRSPSRLSIGYEPTNKYSFENWLSTYKTTGAASKKYLNTGDESTGIRG